MVGPEAHGTRKSVIGRNIYYDVKAGTNTRNSSGGLLNISARTLKDHISVLDLNNPGQDGLYNLHTLTITGNYQSSTNDKTIDLHAIDIEKISPTRLRFFLNNHRPAVDEKGEFLDPKKVGDNATIEIFEHEKGSGELEFVRTIVDPVVKTPNSVVGDGKGGAWVSNDSDKKVHLVCFPLIFRSSIP